MKSLKNAIGTIHLLDDLAGEDTVLTRLSPLAKLGSLFIFLAALASLGPEKLTNALLLLWVLPVWYRLGRLSWKQPLRQLGPVLGMVGSIGLVNLFWFQGMPVSLGPVQIPGGIGVLLLLLLKATGCVLGAYLLLATTSLEKLACALQKLPLPQVLVISLLLTGGIWCCCSRKETGWRLPIGSGLRKTGGFLGRSAAVSWGCCSSGAWNGPSWFMKA